MKFSVTKEIIFTALQHANSFTTSKNLGSILQNVLIQAEGMEVTLKATNFNTAFTASLSADVIEPGCTTVSAKKLFDIVKELPDNCEINFVFEGSRLNIKSGKSSFQMATMDAELFPQAAVITPEYSFNADANTLLSLFKRIAFCISNDTTKIEYNGAHMSLFGDIIEVSSADYQRIATASEKFESSFGEEFIVNIPKKTVQDVIRIFEGAKTIKVETDKRQILFRTDNIIVTSRLIEKYVRGLTRLFDVEYKIKAVVNKATLAEAVKRVASITSEITHGIVFGFSADGIALSSLETEYGKGNEFVSNIEYTGENIDIIFNAKHLLEILANTDSETIALDMNSKNSPVLILPDSKEAKYLLVPISIEKVS